MSNNLFSFLNFFTMIYTISTFLKRKITFTCKNMSKKGSLFIGIILYSNKESK